MHGTGQAGRGGRMFARRVRASRRCHLPPRRANVLGSQRCRSKASRVGELGPSAEQAAFGLRHDGLARAVVCVEELLLRVLDPSQDLRLPPLARSGRARRLVSQYDSVDAQLAHELQ
eukprot:5775147-Prymnesium_polylepis.3